MAAHRYTKVVLTVIALGLVLVAVRPFVEPPAAFSQIFSEDEIKRLMTEPPQPVEVPKAWGKFAGTFIWVNGARFITFEAADGTLRTTLACLRCDIVRK